MRVLVILMLLSSLLVFLNQCSSGAGDKKFLNHDPGVKYVGMDACGECHPDKVATFTHTGMGMSFGSANPEKSKALFGPGQIVYDSFLNYHYQAHWKEDQMYIKEFRLLGKDTVHQLDVPIDYIVGSGQHTNSHLYLSGSCIFQAPLTFYVQKQTWDLPPGYEHGNNSRFSRILDVECISCHNSMPALSDESGFRFENMGKGIDCERCHGPGSLHIESRKGNTKPVGAYDNTIVNPGKISLERQIDICQRCHLQGLNLLKEGKRFTDFIPGMKLSDVFEIYLPRYEGEDESFDMANHAARFQQSECFKQSEEFSCITCHNPHVSVKFMQKRVFNAVCAECHQANGCTEDEEVLKQKENNCVQCHMPAQGTEDIPHVSVHDHYIRVPIKQKQQAEVKKLLGLYAVNNPEPDDRDLLRAYLDYFEKFDKNPFFLETARTMLDRVNDADLWMRYYYLGNEFEKVIETYNKQNPELDFWLAYLLAESYYRTGQGDASISMFRLSNKLLPEHALVSKRYFEICIKLRLYHEAAALGEYVSKIHKYNSRVAVGMAYIAMDQGRFRESEEWLNKAEMLDPDEIMVQEARFNYAMLTGNNPMAKKLAAFILEKYPNHPDRVVLQNISEH